MSEPKPPASAEKSLSYIAWSLKEISENLTKLMPFLTTYFDTRSVHGQKAKQDEIPF
jgi:hypothetical protein